MGHCRGLPLPPNRGPEGDDGETPEVDPAREILATVGPDNAAKYLVASQVQNSVSTVSAFFVFVVSSPPLLSLIHI